MKSRGLGVVRGMLGMMERALVGLGVCVRYVGSMLCIILLPHCALA